VLGGVI
jgi:hypothetical protein